jgi:large conductance mechanosensitive channel
VLKEFKALLISGSVVDMAIGFIFGGAFATVVKSMVDNVVMPPIGLLLGGVDFSSLFIALDGKSYASLADLKAAGAPAIKYGVFINDTVSFVILGFVVFSFIKVYNRIKEPAVSTTKFCPECAMSIPILAKTCPHCQKKQS